MMTSTHSVILDGLQEDFGFETFHDWDGQACLESKQQNSHHPIHVEDW